jgi:hypothetical protein
LGRKQGREHPFHVSKSALHVLNPLAQTLKLSAGNRIGNGLKRVHNRELA